MPMSGNITIPQHTTAIKKLRDISALAFQLREMSLMYNTVLYTWYLSIPMMVDFMRSQVGQIISQVSTDPHHENIGNGGDPFFTLLSGQSPRFTINSMSGRTTCRERGHRSSINMHKRTEGET